MEMLGLASRTDLADTQCGSVAAALELQLRGRDGGSMAQFDREIDRYEKASGETFPENIRVGIALRMFPDGPLKQHLVLNSARLTMWVTLEAEIDNVRRAQAAASSTPQSMDLSAYGTQEIDSSQKGKSHGKGNGKGKDKGDDAMPDLGQGSSLEESLLVQHHRLGGNEQAQGQE